MESKRKGYPLFGDHGLGILHEDIIEAYERLAQRYAGNRPMTESTCCHPPVSCFLVVPLPAPERTQSAVVLEQLGGRASPPRLFESLGLSPIPLTEIGLYSDPLRHAWSQP